MRPSRRKELEEQRAALEKRLERLREVLADLVDAAKKRSGVETKKATDTKSSESKEKSKTPDKPLTEKQKREKREASKEQYEEEKKMSLSTEVDELQGQVRDILSKIKEATAEAQKKSSPQSKPKTASNGR